MNKFRKTLVGLVLVSSLFAATAEANPFKKSLLDYLIFDKIKARKVKKAEKYLKEYASDGYLSPSEISKIYKIIDNKEIREKVSKVKYKLEAEAEARRRAEIARRKSIARKEAYDSAKEEIKEGLRRAGNWLDDKIYNLKRKIRRKRSRFRR